MEEDKTCCICHGPLGDPYGHNPDPVVKDKDAACCGDCNLRVVLPARMDLMFASD
jgi:hypothetical protein